MKKLSAVALLCALPAIAFAHDYRAGDIEILHPHAYETPPLAQTGAGYFTLRNLGGTDDALIAVEADFPKVMIHLSAQIDGMATMTHVERLEIATGQTVELAPGGYHVMFMGLGEDPLEAGEQIPATLVFERAGRVDVTFAVQPRNVEEPGTSSGHASH